MTWVAIGVVNAARVLPAIRLSGQFSNRFNRRPVAQELRQIGWESLDGEPADHSVAGRAPSQSAVRRSKNQRCAGRDGGGSAEGHESFLLKEFAPLMAHRALSRKTIASSGVAPRRTTRSQDFYGHVWNAWMNALNMVSIVQCFPICMSVSNRRISNGCSVIDRLYSEHPKLDQPASRFPVA